MTQISLVNAMKAQNDMKIPFAMQIFPSRLRELVDANMVGNDLMSHDGLLDDIFADYEKLIPPDRPLNIYDCARAVYSALIS